MTFNSKNSLWISSLIAFVLLSFLFFQSQGVEGGLDSWNHYLISRSAIQYPELLLDQWNKPVFSIMTVLVCQLGMNALVWFNIFCILICAILLALAFHKKGFEQSWILIFLVIFIPILFENIISGLTEPLNILMLTTVFYFWMNENFRTSLIIASFLPFVRTEGFIILGTIILFVLYKKQFKHLFWLLIGTIVMNLIGFVITGRRHNNCYQTITDLKGDVNDYFKSLDMSNEDYRQHQGFITSLDRYVNRKEGYKIAKANNQIRFGKEATENGEDSILISENLY